MNTKIQAAILYPQLDSEQRKNEEEEEEPSSKPIQTLPLPFFKRRKNSEKEGKKIIEFENLAAGLRSTLAAQDSCLFVFLSGIPDEPRYRLNRKKNSRVEKLSKGQVRSSSAFFFFRGGASRLGWARLGIFTCRYIKPWSSSLEIIVLHDAKE